MNKPSNTDDFRDDEWEAQEHASREENGETDVTHNDVRVMQYRLIARIARNPPLDKIPPNFAKQIAADIERRAFTVDDRLENVLVRSLIGVLVITGAITTLYLANIYFTEIAASAQQFHAVGVSAIAQWSVVILICLGFSSAVERWQKRN